MIGEEMVTRYERVQIYWRSIALPASVLGYKKVLLESAHVVAGQRILISIFPTILNGDNSE
jgi:hypothetical protein